MAKEGTIELPPVWGYVGAADQLPEGERGRAVAAITAWARSEGYALLGVFVEVRNSISQYEALLASVEQFQYSSESVKPTIVFPVWKQGARRWRFPFWLRGNQQIGGWALQVVVVP